MTMNFSFSPRSFVQALEFLHWWQWAAIAIWAWILIWLLEGYPSIRDYPIAVPKHPVIATIGSFATVWGFFTFVHYRIRGWRLRHPQKKRDAAEEG